MGDDFVTSTLLELNNKEYNEVTFKLVEILDDTGRYKVICLEDREYMLFFLNKRIARKIVQALSEEFDLRYKEEGE